MTQNTLITRIKKVFGAENISNINKFRGLTKTKHFPTISFKYKKNFFKTEGIPRRKKVGDKDKYIVFRYMYNSSSKDNWMTNKLNEFNIKDVENITKRIRKTSTKLPKKKLKLEDFIECYSN